MPPDFFTTPSWKKTALGTPIELVSSAPLEELRPSHERQPLPILLIGGVHGDEPEGVRLAQDTLQWLKTTASQGIRVTPWVVIPCLNVDGFAKGTRVNGRGVDLNRNYPSKDWSPECEKERYFPGSGPGSEPEIQGIVELIQTLRPRLVIHCHSWKPCIVGTGPLAENDTQRLAQSSGYEALPEIGYPTPGSLSRYGWYDCGVPIICIEERDQMLEQDFPSIWPRFAAGMQAIFKDLSLRGADARAHS